MHTAEFSAHCELDCGVETLFQFLTRPRNGPKYSPPDTKLKILDGPEQLQLGSRVKFRLRGFGQRLQLENEVVEFDEPTSFAEEQTSGPMTYWRHCRTLKQISESKTLLTDEVYFTPPKGLVGFVMTESRIRKQLERGFAHQHAVLHQLLEPA
ncbi:MAG: hypothetical protein O3A00_09925 [Planctomycetota bacterium]|nr:hypothetical protein [Planctomycetota bacterium]